MAGPNGEEDAGRGTPFRIDVERGDGRIVVIVAGELDLATAPLLVREVTGELSNPVTSLAIDLGAVTFFDSSGLEAVLTVRRDAQEHGVPFTLASVSRVVRTVLDLNGLNDLLGRTDRPPS